MQIFDQNHSWPLTVNEAVRISELGSASLYPFITPICRARQLSPEHLLCTLCTTSRVSSLVGGMRQGVVKCFLIMKIKTVSKCLPKMSVMLSGGKF